MKIRTALISILLIILSMVCLNADSSAAQVTLSWDAVTDPNLGGYHLYQRVQGTQYAAPIYAGSATQYTVQGLTPGTIYQFVVTAYPSDTTKAQESPYSNEVIAQIPALLGISTTSLPGGTVGVAYSTQLTAIGGAMPYTWTFSPSSLPTGVVGTANGAVSGTPTSAGSYSVVATVNDSSVPVQVATKTFPMTVAAAPPSGVTITTATLPDAVVGTAYSATLSATGGTAPYVWGVCPALPAGLALSFKTGVISGTPTTAGTSALTVTAQDASTPVNAVTKALSVTVAPAIQPPAYTCPCTIWPTTSVPQDTDVQDAASVELGVRFKSDVAGNVIGIRFYKGVSNTGTHVGKLWSGAGTKLATATFTGETASGWQQVNFATPVPITAGTVYTASYHTNAGHYASDNNGLSSEVINPPLHALANGGVYLYGSGGFPSHTYQASNYWVDVVFK